MNTNVPLKLKPLTSYLKTANEMEKRDPVVAYYCRLYAVQRGMELDRSSSDSKKFLMDLMDNLDKLKTELKDNESIISETVGQAYVEEYALRLFSYADKKDRDGDFDQSTIRSFITSGYLMDVLTVFGEVGEDIEKCRKYAKWKAVHISQCLKNGQTPHAGPLEDGNEISGGMHDLSINPGPRDAPVSQPHLTPNQPGPIPTPRTQKSPPKEAPTQPASSYYPDSSTTAVSGGGHLSPEDFAQAEKLCKFATSALQYQDSPTAIDYLTKCLHLLKKSQ